jgi:hypothetical protein
VKLDRDSGPWLQFSYEHIRASVRAVLVRAPASQAAIERILAAPVHSRRAVSDEAAVALVTVEGRAQKGVSALITFAALRREARRGMPNHDLLVAHDVISWGIPPCWGSHLARVGEEIDTETQSVWVWRHADGRELVAVSDHVIAKRRPPYDYFAEPAGETGSLDLLARAVNGRCAAPQCEQPILKNQYRMRKRASSRAICCPRHQRVKKGKYEEARRGRLRDLLEKFLYPVVAEACRCERATAGEFGICTVCEQVVLAWPDPTRAG